MVVGGICLFARYARTCLVDNRGRCSSAGRRCRYCLAPLCGGRCHPAGRCPRWTVAHSLRAGRYVSLTSLRLRFSHVTAASSLPALATRYVLFDLCGLSVWSMFGLATYAVGSIGGRRWASVRAVVALATPLTTLRTPHADIASLVWSGALTLLPVAPRGILHHTSPSAYPFWFYIVPV